MHVIPRRGKGVWGIKMHVIPRRGKGGMHDGALYPSAQKEDARHKQGRSYDTE